MLVANRSGEEEAEAAEALSRQKEAGLEGEIITPVQAKGHHPGVGQGVHSYTWLPGEGLVDAQRLAVAMADAVRHAGGRVLAGKEVREVLGNGNRAHGVLLADGTRLHAEAIVLAAGAWSVRVEGLPEPLPLRPIRGQMLRLRPETQPPWTLLGDHAGRYLSPRENGTILAGSTMEDVGYRDDVTDEGRAVIIESVLDLYPELEDARIVERWAGLRPITPDSWPILGPDSSLDGLFYATGYGRRGILLAPAATEILADLVLDGHSPQEWEPFSIERFRGGPEGSA